MFKFARNWALCWLAMGSLAYAAGSPDDDGGHLKTVLSQLVPDAVEVSIKEGQVTFKGEKSDIDRVTEILRDYDAVRQVLQPANPAYLKTKSSQSALSSWASFIGWTGVNPADYSMVNINAEQITDVDGHWTVKTPRVVHRRVTSAYLEALAEEVPFLRWARENIAEFMSVTEEETVVRYGLLERFLHIDDKQGHEVEGNFVATWSVQDILKVMVAAASGSVSLTKVSENPDTYRVNVIHFGGEKPSKNGVVHLYLDVSGSMGERDVDGSNRSRLDVVREAMPNIFQAIMDELEKGQELTVRVTPFNHDLLHTQNYTLTHGGLFRSVGGLHADGATDLRKPVKSALDHAAKGEPLAVLMTDGAHYPGREYSHRDRERHINGLLEKVRAYLREGGDPFQLFTVQVGHQSEDFFAQFAEIMGTPTYRDSSMKEFTAELKGRVHELLAPKNTVLLQLLDGNQVKVAWLPAEKAALHALPGVFKPGDKVEFKGSKVVVGGSTQIK